MKNKIAIFLFVFSLLSISSCKQNASGPDEGTRIGAVCNDDTTTDATGSGACSHRGGVKYWLYK